MDTTLTELCVQMFVAMQIIQLERVYQEQNLCKTRQNSITRSRNQRCPGLTLKICIKANQGI